MISGLLVGLMGAFTWMTVYVLRVHFIPWMRATFAWYRSRR